MKWVEPIRRNYARMSTHNKILVSFFIVILLLGSMNVTLLLRSLSYNAQYNVIVSNVTEANSINGIVKTRIDSEMWDIVAGKKTFKEGQQYAILDSVESGITHIMRNVRTQDSRTRLDVTLRTMKTLRHYIDMMGDQMAKGSKVADNEAVLEEIRSVSSLIEDDIQEFMLFELNSIDAVNRQIQANVQRWMLTNLIGLGISLLFSAGAALLISSSISKPIRALRRMAGSMADGNLDARVEVGTEGEIAELGHGFNTMADRVKDLLARSVREQENLKKSELRVLQAQINPHFLYNTLDTIVWMAESNKSKQVIEIVKALSSFFRITLSKGRDLITVRNEIEHVRSYLTIQKIRYRDILDFSIDVDEALLERTILKLTLQPVVENALYHGIKNRRSGGLIRITGAPEGEGMRFLVEDNGMGMTPEKLDEIRSELDGSGEEQFPEGGFGLNNVHQRLKLYYGEAYGVTVDSDHGVGTRVVLQLP